MPKSIKCYFGSHSFVIDPIDSGRKFCSRCGMKSQLWINPGMHNGKFRAGGGDTYWQNECPDEGFRGLRTELQSWLERLLYRVTRQLRNRKEG